LPCRLSPLAADEYEIGHKVLKCQKIVSGSVCGEHFVVYSVVKCVIIIPIQVFLAMHHSWLVSKLFPTSFTLAVQRWTAPAQPFAEAYAVRHHRSVCDEHHHFPQTIFLSFFSTLWLSGFFSTLICFALAVWMWTMPAQSWPTFVLPKKKNQALHNVASIIVIQTSNHTMHTLTDTNSTASPRAHFRQHCCAGDKERRHKPQNIGQSTIKLIGKRKTNRATATIREQAKKADVDASAATANAG